jgi:hypothetical protein
MRFADQRSTIDDIEIVSMRDLRLALTAKGLANIPQHAHRNDFDFIIGDVHYLCPSYVADFLSPKICQLHELDASVNEFHIETVDSSHQFGDLLSLCRGSECHFPEESLPFLRSIVRELGNRELQILIVQQFDDELTVSNAVARLRLLRDFDCIFDHELGFIASHFNDFSSSSSFADICYSEFEQILSHPSLTLRNEDQLYDFIVSLLQYDCRFFGLLEFVHFKFISTTTMSKFSELSLAHFDLLNSNIWCRICERLVQEIVNKSTSPRILHISLSPNPSVPLEGIISYLTSQCHGNVHDRGLIIVTGNEPYSDDPGHSAKNAVDLTADSHFYSKILPNQSLCYDFKDLRIRPTHYTIRSRYNGGADDYYLQSWVIEVSMDGSTWHEIDRKEHDFTLKGRNVTMLFPVTHRDECRLIRLRQTGPNHFSTTDHRLIISGFELFGELIGQL